MQVREVRVKYADNGEERYDYYLPGELKARSSRTTIMYGRPVSRVIVIASAGYFWKKPGSFRLDVTAVR